MKGNNYLTLKTVLLPALVCFLFNFPALANNPKWQAKLNRIQPLVSTRQDVEKIIGRRGKEFPSGTNWYYYLVEYETKEGLWNARFSTGKCSEHNKEGFDVDKDVLLEVHFIVNKLFQFSSLQLDKNEFEKTNESDTNNVFYTNYNKGITYTEGNNDLLNSVDIFPSRKFQSLHCLTVKDSN